MLAIILGILKFLGLLILGIIGLAAVILLLVLLIPVRYRAQGSYYGELKGTAGASWLLHILSCRVTYEKELDMCIRVFGIRLGGRKQEPEQEADKKSDQEPEKRVKAAAEPAKAQKTEAEPLEDRKPDEAETAKQPERQDKGNGTQTPPKPKLSFTDPIKKIRVAFRRICGKLKTLKEKKEQILAFLNDEENKETFRLLKKQVFALLKHILPGKLRGRVRFGFDDPYTTGQVLSWISPFYGFYGKNLQVIPVFGEKAMEGELSLKGRIRLGTLIMIVLRMFMDKNFRKLLKKWREA